MIDKLGNKSLVVLKEGEVIFESEHPRLRPIIECINAHNIEGCTVLDKVIGLAAAKLLDYAKVKEIYTKVASKSALSFLNTIHTEKVVDMIMNDNKDEQCPMEKFAKTLSGAELFEKLNK